MAHALSRLDMSALKQDPTQTSYMTECFGLNTSSELLKDAFSLTYNTILQEQLKDLQRILIHD